MRRRTYGQAVGLPRGAERAGNQSPVPPSDQGDPARAVRNLPKEPLMPATHGSVTTLLALLTAGGFVLEMRYGGAFVAPLALWPLHGGFLPWQPLSYAFVHGDAMHLAFNLLGLWLFGRPLENHFGAGMLLAVYAASVLAGAGAQLLLSSISGAPYPTLGASGGVYGLLLAYALRFPDSVIMLLIPPLPLPARAAAILFACVELLLGVTGRAAGVAHFAHLGGMLGAYLVLRQRRRAG